MNQFLSNKINQNDELRIMNNGKTRHIFCGFKPIIHHSIFTILITIILYSLFFILVPTAQATTVTWDGGAGTLTQNNKVQQTIIGTFIIIREHKKL